MHDITLCTTLNSIKIFSLRRSFDSCITWCVQVLRSPKEAFAAATQPWHEHCEKCVCLQGDYLEK